MALASSAAEFGPKMLAAVREKMIARGWARKNINKQIDRLRFVFKWAASEELLAEEVYCRLRTLLPLRKGRTSARETDRIRPVPEEQIQAIKNFVSRQVWAIIQLQLLTAARPGEIVKLRGVDLTVEGKISTVYPEQHKTAYRELSKTIYFGPQSQEILKEFMVGRPLDAYLFSPAESEAERRAKRHAEPPYRAATCLGANARTVPAGPPKTLTRWTATGVRSNVDAILRSLCRRHWLAYR